MFTKENAKEMQAKGVMAKMLFQTPERRRWIARRAVLRRWYPMRAAALDRVDAMLRFFANEVAEALLKDDHKFAVQTASTMLGWERTKIALESGRIKDITPDTAMMAEMEGKLEKARERREKALVGESAPVETTGHPLTTSDTK